jgi:hypothetical protein
MGADPAMTEDVPIAAVSADYYDSRFEPGFAVDGKPQTAWSAGAGTGKPHAIVFSLAADATSPDGTNFALILEQQFGQRQTLGRFRVSVTTDALPLEIEQLGRRIAPRADETDAAMRRTMIFDDDPKFIDQMAARDAKVTHDGGDRFTGGACLRLSRGVAENSAIANMNVPIRSNPGPGEFRYFRYAWRKRGGGGAVLQLADSGSWQSKALGAQRELRYAAGKAEASNGAIVVQGELTDDWSVVTRDLFADFGPINVTGLRLECPDGEFVLLDSVQMARSLEEFERPPR